MLPACMLGLPAEASSTCIGKRGMVGLLKGLMGLAKGQLGTKSCSTQIAYIPSTLTWNA